ncbi:hypothetical protein ACFQZX_09220 [Mucilaginibacter litoreus]|uniref:Uncharacterized protein n=1 Tax=Mucilaginibacter litoreus TaxID=1048221 RepID=A0ABW3ASS7_9SPHI
MKTFTLPHINTNYSFKKGADTSHTLQVSSASDQDKHTLTPTEYVMGVLGEGLKQNFLGADINMEFLTLMVRSYANESVKAVKKIMKKAANGKQPNQTSI